MAEIRFFLMDSEDGSIIAPLNARVLPKADLEEIAAEATPLHSVIYIRVLIDSKE